MQVKAPSVALIKECCGALELRSRGAARCVLQTALLNCETGLFGTFQPFLKPARPSLRHRSAFPWLTFLL